MDLDLISQGELGDITTLCKKCYDDITQLSKPIEKIATSQKPNKTCKPKATTEKPKVKKQDAKKENIEKEKTSPTATIETTARKVQAVEPYVVQADIKQDADTSAIAAEKTTVTNWHAIPIVKSED